MIFCIGFMIDAGTIDPHNNDKQYLEYGENFHCVGKIHGLTTDNQRFYGSCVAFSNRTVLTAAHIIKHIKDGYISINNRTIRIKTSKSHDLFEKDTKGCDIGICYLEDDIGLDWFPELYSGNNEVGKVCSMSGFGLTGTFDSFERKGDEKRRAGSNTIDSIENQMLTCTASKHDKTALEFLISHGDSGGGLFIDNKLAGIHSCIATVKINNVTQNDYYTYSYHTRISDHIDWIRSAQKEIDK